MSEPAVPTPWTNAVPGRRPAPRSRARASRAMPGDDVRVVELIRRSDQARRRAQRRELTMFWMSSLSRGPCLDGRDDLELRAERAHQLDPLVAEAVRDHDSRAGSPSRGRRARARARCCRRCTRRPSSPGAISPSRSAPSIIASAIRSFIEPLGLRCSSFTQTSTPFAGARLAAGRAAYCRSRRARTSSGVVSLYIADPTLYLFDGHNLLHAGGFEDLRELRDTLASWVARRGARGVVVFDGTGQDETRGPLEVRFAPHADSLSSGSRARTATSSACASSRPTRRSARRPDAWCKTVTSQVFVRDLEPVGSRRGQALRRSQTGSTTRRARARAPPPRRMSRVRSPNIRSDQKRSIARPL